MGKGAREGHAEREAYARVPGYRLVGRHCGVNGGFAATGPAWPSPPSSLGEEMEVTSQVKREPGISHILGLLSPITSGGLSHPPVSEMVTVPLSYLTRASRCLVAIVW